MLLRVRAGATGRKFSQEKSHEGRESTYDDDLATPAKPVFALTRRLSALPVAGLLVTGLSVGAQANASEHHTDEQRAGYCALHPLCG